MSEFSGKRVNQQQGGSWATSSGYVEKGAVLTGAYVFDTIMVTNKNAATVYMWVYDAAAASGTPILPPIPVGANSCVMVELPAGVKVTTGLYLAASSTVGTYTALAANDVFWKVGYAPFSGA